jgi:hypothetical protein
MKKENRPSHAEDVAATMSAKGHDEITISGHKVRLHCGSQEVFLEDLLLVADVTVTVTPRGPASQKVQGWEKWKKNNEVEIVEYKRLKEKFKDLL